MENAVVAEPSRLVGPFRAALLGTVTGLAVAGAAACGWWNNGGSATVGQQGKQTIACELGILADGGTLSLASLLPCVGGVVADLITDLESIFAYYTQPSAGPASAGSPAMMCAAPGAPPPYAGAPQCVSADLLSKLQTIHLQAKASLKD